MSSPGSVSHWIAALKDGDSAAAQPLWERYYRQLVGLARKKLRTDRRRAADEEDVVQNAFHSFFKAVDQGRFPQLDDRDSLCENRQKRGGGTPPVAIGMYSVATHDEAALVELVGDSPTPDFAAQVADEYRRLLESLGDDSLRQVAIWKMEGFGSDEIAQKLGCSRRTVARKLDAIRTLWSSEAAP
jgi:DNA-directed RNA polymerase specialized sigma24 family protein